MWKHKESKWLVRGGRKVKCYLCGKKILAKGDLFLSHQDTGYYSHQSCLTESATISGNERRRAVKKIAVGAAVVGAIAAGAGKLIDISSQSKGSNSPDTQTILTSQGLIPPALTSDPANPVPGQMWYRSDAGVMAHFDAVQNRVVYSSEINDGNVNVTSKGIINGLSVLPNDGKGGFGPDTTKGATAPGQYGSPYTQTSGIQEAINSLPLRYIEEYDVYSPTGRIYIKSGVYNCTDTITINTMAQVEIIGEVMSASVEVGAHPSVGGGVYINSTGSSGAIIESTSSPQAMVGRIRLENLYIQYTLPSGYSSINGNTIINTSNFNETILIGIRVGTQSDLNNQTVIAAGNGSDNLFYVDRVFTHAPTAMTHLQSFSNHLHIVFLAMYGDPDNGPSQGFTNATNGGMLYIGGAYDDIIEHVNYFGTCYTLLSVLPENHDLTSPSRNSSLFIASMYCELGTPSQLTGFYPFAIYKNTIIESFETNTFATGYNPLTDATNYYALPMTIRSVCNTGSVPSPTLSPNPPVSGTVYQNTNPYDIEIDLPVYATTAGTAGYVTVAKGATDTPTAIGNQYVSGDTSATSEQIIRLRVPANWYYEFTASGVTFGTASVFAE